MRKKKTSRSTKFNVKFFARAFLKKDTSELRLHFVFTHKGLSVKRGIGVGVEVFFLLKNAVLWLGLGLDVERHERVTIARIVKSNCLPFLCVFKKINLNLRSTINLSGNNFKKVLDLDGSIQIQQRYARTE